MILVYTYSYVEVFYATSFGLITAISSLKPAYVQRRHECRDSNYRHSMRFKDLGK